MSTFRAFWPITDPAARPRDLITEATCDLPRLAAQAHARITGPGKWSISPSAAVPGSGHVTEDVLLFEAPATEGRAPYADSRQDGAA